MLYGIDRVEYRLFPAVGLRLEDLKARPDAFQRDLRRIRPLIERPFDFERRYLAAHPAGPLPLGRNLHGACLRRLLRMRWGTLMARGGYPGMLDPL